MIMLKKALQKVTVFLTIAILLVGCGGKKVELPTDLTTFTVEKINFYSTYGDSLKAEAGNKLLVVAMTSKEEFDETQMKHYFQSDDGQSVAIVYADNTPYDCIAVGVQGKERDSNPEFVLVFEVPQSVEKAALITLEAPGQAQVAIKGTM